MTSTVPVTVTCELTDLGLSLRAMIRGLAHAPATGPTACPAG